LPDNSPDSLSEPEQQEKQRSLQLQQRIRAACDRTNGWILFSDFMNMALYEPGLGYYSGGLQKFGQRGDFITAPEVSSLFAMCLASQLAEVLANLRQESDQAVRVLEFGAGSGILAADILLELEQLDCLPEKYFILELAGELRQRQSDTIRQKVPHLFGRVQWLDSIPEKTENAVVIANEVLDAMPVECFRVAGSGSSVNVESLVIGMQNEELVSRYRAADKTVTEKVTEIAQRSEITFSEGYCSEFNPAIKGWLSALENKIRNLVILVIDYGYNETEYYYPDRRNGTLMCYYRHRAHGNYLWWPGLQDITAFVDFSDVAYSAVECGMEVSGYTTQAAFLLANGLSERHAELVTDDVRQQVKLSQQIKTLTLPSEMGERFKVMAITKNYNHSLVGFSMLDLRNRL
jgi:SAM-dependent MidA family methyltransferase